MLKKLLCFALVLSLCLAVCPVGAWATEGDGNTSTTQPGELPGAITEIDSVKLSNEYVAKLTKDYDTKPVTPPDTKDLILVVKDADTPTEHSVPEGYICTITPIWYRITSTDGNVRETQLPENELPTNAGDYSLKATVTLTTQGGTSPDDTSSTSATPINITDPVVKVSSFKISERPVIPKFRTTPITMEYTGSANYNVSDKNPNPFDDTASGIVPGDTTVTLNAHFHFLEPTVGNKKEFYADTVSLEGTGKGNYDLKVPAELKTIGNITPAFLVASTSDTILVRNRQARTYTYNLEKLLPTLPNVGMKYEGVEFTVKSTQVNLDSFFTHPRNPISKDSEDITIDETNNIMTIKVREANYSGSHDVGAVYFKITSKNFQDFDATLHISSDDRTPIKILNLEAADRPQYTGSGILGYSGLPDFKVILSNDELQDLPKDESIDRSTLVKSYRSTANSQSGEYGPTETPPTKPGIYEVTVSIPDSNKDYAGSWKGTFTITKAKVTVRAKDRTIKVDDPVPTFKNPELGVDYTVTGLAPGDTLKTAPTMKYATVADAIMPGEFDILIDGAMVPSNTYYDPAIIYEKGKLIVKSQLDDGGDENPFSDVSEYAWYVTAVKYVYNKGLMQGTTSTLFSPTRTLTRAMLVTILYRLDGEWPVWSTMPFTDLDRNAYYLDAVRWASSNHIVNGYGDGRFGPNDALTREQLAIILYNYSKYRNVSVSSFASLDAFTDAYRTTPTGYRALQWACAEGLIQGTGSTTISPKEKAIRAQVAVILMRYCTNVLNESD